MGEKSENSKKSLFNHINLSKALSKSSVHMEVSGNSELVFEGGKGVLEYTDTSVKVNAGAFILSVTGRGMTIKCLSESAMVVCGYIISIEFLT